MQQIMAFIDKKHWLWLIFAAPFYLFPTTKTIVLLLLVPGLWVLQIVLSNSVKRKKEGKQNTNTYNCIRKSNQNYCFPLTPLNFSFLCLSIMLFVSLFATYSISQSLEKISGLIYGIGVFYSVVRLGQHKKNWFLCLIAYLFGGTAWTLLALFGMDYRVRFSFLSKPIRWISQINWKLPGTVSGLQHNAVGGTSLWFFPLMILLSLVIALDVVNDFRSNNQSTTNEFGRLIKAIVTSSEWKNPDKKLVQDQKNSSGEISIYVTWLLRAAILGSTLLTGIVIFLAQSRGTYFALLSIMTAIFFISIPSRDRRVIVIIITLIIILIGLLTWDSILIDLIENFQLADDPGFSLDSIRTRVEIWSRAIYGIYDFSWTGMGMNTFRKVVHWLYPLSTIPSSIDFGHAHNEFLQVALDLGIPGLIGYISVLLITGVMLIKLWFKQPVNSFLEGPVILGRSLLKMIKLGLAAGFFGHLIFGLFDAISLGAKPGIFFWFLLGLITSLYKNQH